MTERLSSKVSRKSTFTLLALNDKSGTSIGDAAHVWLSDSGSIRSLGGKDIAFALDNLMRGPSSLQSREHDRLRAQTQRSEHDPIPVSSTAFARTIRRWGARPVLFWVGPTLREQLSFWWACHVIVSNRLHVNAWFTGPTDSEVDPDPRAGLQIAPLDDLARLYGEARVLSMPTIRTFAARWAAFCRGKRPVTAGLTNWCRDQRWAIEVPAIFDARFPRTKRGRLSPSAVDEELLSSFARSRWATPLSVIRSGVDWPLAMSFLGETVPARLKAWAQVEGGRFLASRPTSGKRAWDEREYRLTREGRALLTTGVPDATVVPPMPFGGFS